MPFPSPPFSPDNVTLDLTAQGLAEIKAGGVGSTQLAASQQIATQTSNSGKFLTTNGTVTSWATVPGTLPDQTGNSGKYLTTDGNTASWATLATLPTQTGNSGKLLTTDGSNASWASYEGWKLLETLSPSNVSSISSSASFSGYTWLRFVYRVYRSTGSGIQNLEVIFNGDTGATDYYSFAIVNATPTSTNGGSMILGTMTDGGSQLQSGWLEIVCTVAAGRYMAGFGGSGYQGIGAGIRRFIDGSWRHSNGTTTNITSATFQAAAAFTGTIEIFAR